MEDTETVYAMYETLNVLDDMLSENGFIRTHQSCLDGQDTFIRLLDMLEIPHN